MGKQIERTKIKKEGFGHTMDNYILILIAPNDWGTFIFAPQFIVGKNNEFIPVFIGNGYEENSVGVYLRGTDIDKIDHDSIYILINNPDVDYETLKDVIDEAKSELDETETSLDSKGFINIGLEFDVDSTSLGKSKESTYKLH